MKLLCLDGNSILNRAFYGIKPLTTKEGEFTNAVFGFMNILLNLLEQEKPDGVAVAFDLPAKTFRHEMFDGYKAGRSPMPDELRSQFPIIKELLSSLGYSVVEKEGYEADDILGTLAAACSKSGDVCVLASGDRDCQQLISEKTKLLLTTTKFGRGETEPLDVPAIVEKYGVTPKQLIDVKALAGDSSDKIPGAKGIGEVTACKLIADFGDLDNLYENLDDERIKAGVRTKLATDKENVYLSRKLAEIFCDVPIDKSPIAYEKKDGDRTHVASLLSRLEMKKLIERLGLSEVEVNATPSDADAPPTVKNVTLGTVDMTKTLFFVSDGDIFCTDGEVYEEFSTFIDEERLGELLSCESQKIFFDAKEFYRLGGTYDIEVKNAIFDIKLAAYLLNPAAKSYDVKSLSTEYGVGGGDAFSLVVPLFSVLEKRLSEDGMTALLLEMELPLSRVLAEMELVGFAVDRGGIKRFGDKLSGEIAKLVADIYEAVGYEFNLNSPKQLGVALFEKLELPTRKKTKTGYSTDAETLESLASYHPAVSMLLRYRTLSKLLSTYVEGLSEQIEEDGRIHTVFKQTETRTGRISSKEPNLQNIPIRTEQGRELRRFFVAGEGRTLVDADYSQIELRIVAALSGDEQMTAAFASDSDIHRITAAKVFRVPPEMVTEEMRRSAKAVNFGIVYGIGAFSLAKDIDVSVKEADGFIKNYLKEFSGVDAYLKEVVENAKRDGYVTTYFKRRRNVPELRASNANVKKLGERVAMNTPIQGTAADIIKIAMIRVSDRLREELPSAKLILQVHDELLVECEENDTPRAKIILKEEMEKACKLSVDFPVEVHSGKDWLDAH